MIFNTLRSIQKRKSFYLTQNLFIEHQLFKALPKDQHEYLQEAKNANDILIKQSNALIDILTPHANDKVFQ